MTSVQSTAITPVSSTLPATSQRSLHVSAKLRLADKKPTIPASAADTTEHEGSFARTDASVQVDYPEENELPSSKTVQGRGGLHFKRTLASFSLEGKVGVVTGGARGLGLVMSQALVISGADIAIVDLNSMYKHFWWMHLDPNTDQLAQRRKLLNKPRNWLRTS